MVHDFKTQSKGNYFRKHSVGMRKTTLDEVKQVALSCLSIRDLNKHVFGRDKPAEDGQSNNYFQCL